MTEREATTASGPNCSQCGQLCGSQYTMLYPATGTEGGKPWCYNCTNAASIRASEDERILHALVSADNAIQVAVCTGCGKPCEGRYLDFHPARGVSRPWCDKCLGGQNKLILAAEGT